MAIMSSGVVTRSNTELATAILYRDGIKAQYLAEAGVRWASSQLDYQPVGGVREQLLPPLAAMDSSSCKVSVYPRAVGYKIVAVATVGSARRAVCMLPGSGELILLTSGLGS